MIGEFLCWLGFHRYDKHGDCPRCGYNRHGMHTRPYRDWYEARAKK